MSEEMKACPKCESPYGYSIREDLYECPECSNQWNPAEVEEEGKLIVKDANGNILEDGDSVVVLKNLNVKGAQGPIKAGTKVRRIRLIDGDHNIACKIDGFGAMELKSQFVKKS